MANIYAKHNMVKHVGLLGDKRCVVVLQLPEDLENVHVVDSDALPDQYHQALMSILESNQAQSSVWLGDVLSRRVMPDGGNALKVLYQYNFIKIVPVSNVTMVPRPNQHVALSEVIKYMNGTTEVTQENVSNEMQAIQEAAQHNLNENTLVNQHVQNFAGDDAEQRRAKARNIMVEVTMLQNEVNKKMEIAYAIDPSLRPTQGVAETVTESVKSEFVDSVTGKVYQTASALKGAETRRANKANKA